MFSDKLFLESGDMSRELGCFETWRSGPLVVLLLFQKEIACPGSRAQGAHRPPLEFFGQKGMFFESSCCSPSGPI